MRRLGFEVYPRYRFSDGSKQWYWRLRSGNGLIIGDGSEGYLHRRDCVKSLNKIRLYALFASVKLIDFPKDDIPLKGSSNG